MADSNTTSGSDEAAKPRLSLKLKKEDASPAPADSTTPPPDVPKKKAKPSLKVAEPAASEAQPVQDPEASGSSLTPEIEQKKLKIAKAPVIPSPLPKPIAGELEAASVPAGESEPPSLTSTAAEGPEALSAPESPAPDGPSIAETSPVVETDEGESKAEGRPLRTLGIVFIIFILIAGGLAYFGRSLLTSLDDETGEPAEPPRPAITTSVAATPAATSEPAGILTGALAKARAVTEANATRTAQADEVIDSDRTTGKPLPTSKPEEVDLPLTAESSEMAAPALQIQVDLPPGTLPESEVQGLPEVYALVDTLIISMVMPSSRGDRIVVDNVAYGQGDVLEPSWGLRFVRAEPQFKRIVFRDARGAIYYKSY